MQKSRHSVSILKMLCIYSVVVIRSLVSGLTAIRDLLLACLSVASGWLTLAITIIMTCPITSDVLVPMCVEGAGYLPLDW